MPKANVEAVAAATREAVEVRAKATGIIAKAAEIVAGVPTATAAATMNSIQTPAMAAWHAMAKMWILRNSVPEIPSNSSGHLKEWAWWSKTTEALPPKRTQVPQICPKLSKK